MSLELKGRVIAVLPQERGMGKKGEWIKQSFILETPGNYPKKVCLVAWNDKVTEYNVKVGIEVTAHLDIESREYNGRWYTEIRVWKMERTGGTAQEPVKSQTSNSDTFGDKTNKSQAQVDDFSDLPF